MTPFIAFDINIGKAEVFPSIFAIATYLGNFLLTILLESNTIPVSKRGFFCNDNSIKYPYQEETISGGSALLIHVTTVITTFIIGETLPFNKNKSYTKQRGEDGNIFVKLYNSNHLWYVRVLKLVLLFCWCASATMVLTSIIKTVVGWPRPNFMAVCNPNITCSPNNTIFNTDYECKGTTLLGDWKRIDGKQWKSVNQARRSFPSGHASSSATVMAFTVLYVEMRIPSSDSLVLVKPFIQIVSICVASFIAMSRVSDYYHHVVDVIFGGFLGIVIGLMVGRNCMKWLISLDDPNRKEEYVRLQA